MIDYVEYKPPADGVAPRGWQEGMCWALAVRPAQYDSKGKPEWEGMETYIVPPAALHYPIAPYEGKLGADIAVNGRPEWLPDGQKCQARGLTHWYDRAKNASEWLWEPISAIRLPASHGYYADNPEHGRIHSDGSRSGGQPASDEAHYDGAAPTKAFNLEGWLPETKANLPAIEAAGHSVTFAPDWAERLWRDCWLVSTSEAIDLIRSRVRPVL